MKKIFFFAAIAALALSSCSSDELVQAEQPVEDGAVLFSAYTGRATRATTIDIKELGEHGFGVFAYEQGPVKWDTYRASNTYPNFMYNQKVDKFGESTTACNYAAQDITTLAVYDNTSDYVKSLYSSPTLKAKGDASSFTSEQQTVLKTTPYGWVESDAFAVGDTHTITYAQYVALSGPLWANKAQLFELKAKVTSSEKLDRDQYNALSVTDQAHFTYTAPTGLGSEWKYSPIKYFSNNDGAQHSFFAYAPYQKDVKAVFTDKGPGVRYNVADDYDLLYAVPAAAGTGSGEVTNSVNKLIDVEKATITGVVGMNFKHALSKVSFEATYFVDTKHDGSHPTTNTVDEAEKPNFLDANTKVIIRSVKLVGQLPSQGVLSLYDGTWTYEKIEEGACEVVGSTTFIWDGAADKSATYKPLKNDMVVIPTQQGDKVQVQVVYDVITTDLENPKNNSTITNTITSTGDGYALEAGKAYNFKLDLGLTSVKFNVGIVDEWGTPDTNNVDLPDNKN